MTGTDLALGDMVLCSSVRGTKNILKSVKNQPKLQLVRLFITGWVKADLCQLTV